MKLNSITNHIEIVPFGKIDIMSPFFDVFRTSYGAYFIEWWRKKQNDPVYVVKETDDIVGFLKLKVEDHNEDYSDIIPQLLPQKRLKICSIKINRDSAPSDLGCHFMQLIMSRAIQENVDEIYGTVAVNCSTTLSVERYLKKWGFHKFGTKFSHGVYETVYVNNQKVEWLKHSFNL